MVFLLGIIGSIGLIICAVWLLTVYKNEKTRKLPLIGCGICLLLILIGLSGTLNHSPASSNMDNGKPHYQARVGSLAITYQITDSRNTSNQTQIIITTKNEGSLTYSGAVEFKSLNSDGIYMDMQILHFFNLKPGQSRNSTCWLRLAEPPKIAVTADNI